MKQAKVSELKARLSEYLASVRAGGTVTVYNRSTAIARIVPIDDGDSNDIEVEEATAPLAGLRKIRPIPLRGRIDVDRLLRESRGPR